MSFKSFLVFLMRFAFSLRASVSLYAASKKRKPNQKYFCDSLDFLCFVGVSLYARNKKIQNIQKLVGSSGLEPPTSRLSGVRSNHLSYEPMLLSSVCLSYLSLFLSEVVEMNGIEPMTPCLQSRCSPS